MAWSDTEHNAVVKALALTCELTSTSLSDAAKALMVKLLSTYDARSVVVALDRCASECKQRVSLADVISRITDGRPGPEEAWALMPKTEAEAACVTEEMSIAWGAAAPLVTAGDHVAARMAFKETYERAVREARARREPPRWRLSAGWDRALTESAAIDGMGRGLLEPAAALQFIQPERREQALIAAGCAPLALSEAS